MGSEKKIFECFYFLKIYPIVRLIKRSNKAFLDESLMKHGILLDKRFFKKKIQISPITEQK